LWLETKYVPAILLGLIESRLPDLPCCLLDLALLPARRPLELLLPSLELPELLDDEPEELELLEELDREAFCMKQGNITMYYDWRNYFFMICMTAGP
jgi:hypothetical protein